MAKNFDPIKQKESDGTTTEIDWSSYNINSSLPIVSYESVELKKLKKSYKKLETQIEMLKEKLSLCESERKKLQHTNNRNNNILDHVTRALFKLDLDNPTIRKLLLEHIKIIELNINE